MKIETSQITRLRITELQNLDPVEVIVDNIAEHKGKITISCYGKSWTAYWGGMGAETVQEFFNWCSNDYLIGCLAPQLLSTVPDTDADGHFIKAKILHARRNSELSKEEAKDLWSDLNLGAADRETIMYGHPSSIAEFLGPEPWHIDWPEARNHDYTYLSRICDAVKAAFDEQKEVA
ncbi:hypothetical protein O1V64_10945 [Rouxiella badensis]|nr:hypothetical protein O1V64_10945 [Rouxiella badensis]